jgi:hypothetical protein
MRKLSLWFVTAVSVWALAPVVRGLENASDYPMIVTRQVSAVEREPECVSWFTTGNSAYRLQEVYARHCHSWQAGVSVRAKFLKSSFSGYPLVELLDKDEKGKEHKFRCMVLVTTDAADIGDEYPVSFTVLSAFVSGDDCFMSIRDGGLVYDILDRGAARNPGESCLIFKPGNKVEGRFERQMRLVRFKAIDGRLGLYVITGKQFAQ